MLKWKVKHHYYWVSYSFEKQGNTIGVGAFEVCLVPKKLKVYSDIEMITTYIKNKLLSFEHKIVILNYTFMRTERKYPDA